MTGHFKTYITTTKKMKKIGRKVKQQSEQLGTRVAKTAIRYRWLILAASLMAVMFMGYGAKNVGFNSDYHVFFSEDNPQLLAYDALQNKYTKDDNVFIVLEPEDGKVFTKKTLSAIEGLTQKSWKTPYSSRVDAITNFQYTKAVEDDLYVDDLIENASNKSEVEIAELRKIATTDPRTKNRLVNEEGTVTAVNITVRVPDADNGENKEIVAYVRGMVDTFKMENPNINVYMSGMTMMNNAFMEIAEGDMGTLTPLMFLIIVITILVVTRSIVSAFSTFMVIIFTLVGTMGIAGWIGIGLTPPSAAFMNIIMTLAVADSIHILISFIQARRKGVAKYDAIVDSVRINFMPVFITSITTIVGFLSMNTSDSPPFRDLGNLTAIGMALAFIFSITTLPALIAILPSKVKLIDAAKKQKAGFLENLAEFVIAKSRVILIGSTVFVIIGSVFIIKNDLNDEFVKYFSKNIDFRTDTDYISENLTGIYTTEFSIGAGESGGINNPEYLSKLEDFENWLYTHEEVIHVNSFTEVARLINKSMHGDNEAYYKLPDTREEAAQYLLLYEMSLPFGLDLNNQVNVDKSETRLIVTTKNLPAKKMLALTGEAEQWLKDNTPKYMHTAGVSNTMMFAHLTQRQIKSMISGTVLALILISLILALAIKSFRYGMISLIPNITPVLVGLGIWGVAVGYINTGISIVFGMTLGIIVDDTVHFLSKFLRAKRELGKNNEDAIRYAFSTVGQALIVTTFVLIAGFMVLTFSDFGMNSGMAKITVLIIFLALVLDFLLLPVLLLLGKEKPTLETKKEEEPTLELTEA